MAQVGEALHYNPKRSRIRLSIVSLGHNLSGRTMAIGSTQPVTEMSTWGYLLEVKAAGALG